MSIEVTSKDGLALAVDRVGDGEAVVLVHGLGFSRKRLHELICPALVAHGTRDMIIPYVAGQLLNEGLIGSRSKSFNGTSHSLAMERGSESAGVPVDFLDSVKP